MKKIEFYFNFGFSRVKFLNKQTLNKSERPNLKFAKVAKVNPPIIIINTVVKLLIVKYGAYGILM